MPSAEPPLPYVIPADIYKLPIPHVRIKLFFIDQHKATIRLFKKGLKLTDKIDDYVSNKLSDAGRSFKQDGFLSLDFAKYGYTQHYEKGYRASLNGENPYVDALEYPRIYDEIRWYSKPVADFIKGYYDSTNDQYILKFVSKTASAKKSKNTEPKIGTLILKKYFEMGGKPLNKNQVIALAKKSDFTVGAFKKKWYSLRDDEYSHKEGSESVTRFLSSYTYLLQIFQEGSQPHNLVKEQLEILKGTYRDLGI